MTTDAERTSIVWSCRVPMAYERWYRVTLSFDGPARVRADLEIVELPVAELPKGMPSKPDLSAYRDPELVKYALEELGTTTALRCASHLARGKSPGSLAFFFAKPTGGFTYVHSRAFIPLGLDALVNTACTACLTPYGKRHAKKLARTCSTDKKVIVDLHIRRDFLLSKYDPAELALRQRTVLPKLPPFALDGKPPEQNTIDDVAALLPLVQEAASTAWNWIDNSNSSVFPDAKRFYDEFSEFITWFTENYHNERVAGDWGIWRRKEAVLDAGVVERLPTALDASGFMTDSASNSNAVAASAKRSRFFYTEPELESLKNKVLATRGEVLFYTKHLPFYEFYEKVGELDYLIAMALIVDRVAVQNPAQRSLAGRMGMLSVSKADRIVHDFIVHCDADDPFKNSAGAQFATSIRFALCLEGNVMACYSKRRTGYTSPAITNELLGAIEKKKNASLIVI